MYAIRSYYAALQDTDLGAIMVNAVKAVITSYSIHYTKLYDEVGLPGLSHGGVVDNNEGEAGISA